MTKPERWQQITRLYQAALQCEAIERAAFLDQVCAGDPPLRRELESLLAHEESVGGLLGRSAMDDLPSLVGRTVGSYEVQALLGAGGMGEVYRARDTRLSRDVALKILPPLFALDVERLARFRREAQLLASLNHPNIAHIYGIEDTADVHGLVLELVEGPTLADRIAQGAVPIGEALPIARQIASALQAAHERGVVHRDLKPANIKVRSDGTVKVLDFGLAKALAPDLEIAAGEAGPPPARHTPMMTARGAILGTVAYMAPEQARGKESDTRVDIWAFGVVLYEMLTGRSPFAGDSVADTVGAVLHSEPAWEGVPGMLKPLLQSCLQKDPTRRLQNIADARPWLDEAPAETARSRRRWTWVASATAAAFFVATVVLSIAYFRERLPAANPVRFQIPAPPGSAFANYFVVSPDGRAVAFLAADAAGQRTIWVHSLDSGESRPLPRAGNLSSSSIFWSPDSRFIGFVSGDGTLRKIDIAGGPAQTICDVPGNWGGASWGARGIIVFGRGADGLMQVPAAGGTPAPLTVLDVSRQEFGHGGPRFLPDGRHFIYGRASKADGKSGVFVGSLDVAPADQPSEPLLMTTARPVYAPSDDPRRGHLLLVSDGVLLAYPFDTRSLTLAGDPVTIAEDAGAVPTQGVLVSAVSASTNGVLAYRGIDNTNLVPVWVDRHGRELGPLVTSPLDRVLDRVRSPRIAPDGRRIALVVADDLWVYDADGRPPMKLNFGSNVQLPLWTPDGRRIVFDDNSAGRLMSVPADNSGPPQPAGPPGRFYPLGWAPDRWLLAGAVSGTDVDILRLRLDDAMPEPVVRTAAAEGAGGAAVSPDGRWLAYTSNATGRYEVWVRPYPGPGAPVRISPNEGIEPVWASGGGELYYLEPGRVMSVPVKTGARFEFGAPIALFENQYSRAGPPSYDVASDGRFLMIKPSAPAYGTAPIQVVLNWTALLKAANLR